MGRNLPQPAHKLNLIICWQCVYSRSSPASRVPLERIVQQRDWRPLRAVHDRKIFYIRDEWLNMPAPTLLRGLHAIAAALHPDTFDPPKSPDDLRRVKIL